MSDDDQVTETTSFTAAADERIVQVSHAKLDGETTGLTSIASYDVVGTLSGSGIVQYGDHGYELRPESSVKIPAGVTYSIVPDVGTTMLAMILSIQKS